MDNYAVVLGYLCSLLFGFRFICADDSPIKCVFVTVLCILKLMDTSKSQKRFSWIIQWQKSLDPVEPQEGLVLVVLVVVLVVVMVDTVKSRFSCIFATTAHGNKNFNHRTKQGKHNLPFKKPSFFQRENNEKDETETISLYLGRFRT